MRVTVLILLAGLLTEAVLLVREHRARVRAERAAAELRARPPRVVALIQYTRPSGDVHDTTTLTDLVERCRQRGTLS